MSNSGQLGTHQRERNRCKRRGTGGLKQHRFGKWIYHKEKAARKGKVRGKKKGIREQFIKNREENYRKYSGGGGGGGTFVVREKKNARRTNRSHRKPLSCTVRKPRRSWTN